MSIDTDQELHSFHQFIVEQLDAGQTSLSPEEALDIWRSQHPSAEQYAEDVQALREALADMDAGDTGTPVDIYLAEFRKQQNLEDC